MKVLRLVVWGIIGLCGTSAAHAADPLRLEDAVARALAAHPSVVAEMAQLRPCKPVRIARACHRLTPSVARWKMSLAPAA